MFERLKAMLIKEFIQVLRDPRTRFVIFVFPVFQVVVFGYAVNTDVRNSRTAVLDRDNSRESREIIERFQARVAIRKVGTKGGRLEIHFSDPDELTRIIDLLEP